MRVGRRGKRWGRMDFWREGRESIWVKKGLVVGAMWEGTGHLGVKVAESPRNIGFFEIFVEISFFVRNTTAFSPFF